VLDVSKDFTSGHADSYLRTSPGAESGTSAACWMLQLHNPIVCGAVDDLHVERPGFPKKSLDPVA